MIFPAVIGCARKGFDPDTVLLLPMTGADESTTFTDIAKGGNAPHTVTANGDAQIDTAIADPFSVSGGVGTFDGTGDYCSIPDDSNFDLPDGTDYTLEFWARPTTMGSFNRYILNKYVTDGNQRSWAFYIQHTDSKLLFGRSTNGYLPLDVLETTNALALDTWVHIAVSRSGSTTRLFRAGVLQDSGTLNNIYSGSAVVTIGAVSAGFAFAGQISDVAITLRAKYTANFTPPGRLSA